jgi:uncharacterized protein with ParB-like and HNH nuclease domain
MEPMSNHLPSQSPLTSPQISDEESEANSDAGLDSQLDTEDEVVVDGVDEGDLDHSDTMTNVVIEKNDRSLAELERWFRDGRLVLDPEWQRNYVWTSKAASRLIESFLIDLPVPVIYLARDAQGTYEVIDGLQRLTSVFKFFDGDLRLTGLEIRPELNGKIFKALERPLQNKLRDVTVRTFELAPNTSKDLMFVIFERLNSGGTALNDMEIRNCLYRGSLNRLIKELAVADDLKSCVNQPNIAKRMMDRLLVLRFLAFYERTYLKATKGLKKFLNDFLDAYRNPPQTKLHEFEREFRKAMRSSVTVFGEYGFRLRKSDSKRASEWATRVNAAVFQVISVSFTQYDATHVTRNADAIFEEYLDLVTRDNRWVDAVSRSTGDPERIMYTFEVWNKRLEAVMRETGPNDKTRCFSLALKKEMFAQNPVCAICKQQIRLVNDAALDHEEHYWRGGRTVPENARLVHRLCNWARPS